MTRKARAPRERSAVVTALELMIPSLGGAVPADVKARKALAIVEKHLMDDESHTLVSDLRAHNVALIQEGGRKIFFLLTDFLILQSELWKHDILVRGAVTIGNIESKSDFLAGQGLRDADRLLGLAAVPRVIVDPDALAAVEEEPYLRVEGLTTRQELHSIKRLLKCDGDGLWFIDYLAQNEELNVLHEHRFLVERGLQSAKTLDHESRMWTWLFTYHNRVVEDLHARGQIDDAKRRELRIPAKSPLVFEFPPGS